MTIWIALILGWAFERAQMIISAPNYESVFNGFGAIDLVNRRESKAPMSYRVLVPWLVWVCEHAKIERIAIYQALKVILNTFAFYAVGLAFGLPAALLVVALLLLTIKFDYWDWAAEIIGVCLALTGNPALAIIGAAVHGLSRETALLVPAAFFIKTGNIGMSLVVLAVTLAALAIPRVWAGKKPLYCDRWMWKYNLNLFRAFGVKDFWKWGQWFHQDIFIAAALTGLTIASVLLRGSVDGLIPLAILGAGWTMAKADETRVFAVCLPWIAFAMVGG